MKEIENTILAMCDWLDENTDGYLTIATRNGKSICVLSDKTEKLIVSLATAMEEVPALKQVITEAGGAWIRYKLNSLNRTNDDTSL